MEMDFKTKKKKIYIPLKKIIKEIIKGLKNLDLNIPIVQIARMDVAGVFQDKSNELLRKTILDYLQTANKYRKAYFEFMKNTKNGFDREMSNDGSFAPGLKQYNSIKIQLSEALLKTDGKAWIMSYDQYLPTIRNHSSKSKKHPRSGRKMFRDIKNGYNKNIKEIKDLQKLTIQISKLFLKDLNYAIKNPDLDWQEWLIDDDVLKKKKKSSNLKEI